MILSPEIVHQIKGHKRTMVRIPRSGKAYSFCPYREKHVYAVKSAQKAKQACEITVETVTEAIFESQPIWEIRFKLGNHTDEDRYPAARAGGAEGDYTSVPSRKLNGTGAEVSAHELSRYALTAHESHENGLSERRERLLRAIGQIRLEMARQGVGSPLARKRLKSVEHELRRLATVRTKC